MGAVAILRPTKGGAFDAMSSQCVCKVGLSHSSTARLKTGSEFLGLPQDAVQACAKGQTLNIWALKKSAA
jgi:hypothetical protein